MGPISPVDSNTQLQSKGHSYTCHDFPLLGDK